MTTPTVVLVLIEGLALIGSGVWLGVGEATPTESTRPPWVWPEPFDVALGVAWAVTAVVPLAIVVLWAGGTLDSPRREPIRGRVVTALVGTVLHVGFTVWLLADMMFPREFQGATGAPFVIGIGQVA